MNNTYEPHWIVKEICPDCGKRKTEDMKRCAPCQNKRDERNRKARERRQAYKDLGLVRVRGAMGGVYYE